MWVDEMGHCQVAPSITQPKAVNESEAWLVASPPFILLREEELEGKQGAGANRHSYLKRSNVWHIECMCTKCGTHRDKYSKKNDRCVPCIDNQCKEQQVYFSHKWLLSLVVSCIPMSLPLFPSSARTFKTKPFYPSGLELIRPNCWRCVYKCTQYIVLAEEPHISV